VLLTTILSGWGEFGILEEMMVRFFRALVCFRCRSFLIGFCRAVKIARMNLVVVVLATSPLIAQSFDLGFTPYGSYSSAGFDSVNLVNGNLIAHIPLISYSQRGTMPDLAYSLLLNNVGYYEFCQNPPNNCSWKTSNPFGFQMEQDNLLTFNPKGRPPAVIDHSGATHGMSWLTSANGGAATSWASYDTSGITVTYQSD
jgi:hypothetical protein